MMKTDEAVAETIENNVRKLIINESPVDPAYYDKLSKLLDALIAQRRLGVATYAEYMAKIAKLTQEATSPGGVAAYPAGITTSAQKALFNNLGKNLTLALAVDAAVLSSLQDDWRNNSGKTKRVRNAIRAVLEKGMAEKADGPTVDGVQEPGTEYSLEAEITRILDLVKHQSGY